MSRIIAAVILISLLTGLCISDRIVINHSYNSLNGYIIECENAVDSKDNKELAGKLKKEFERKEGLLSVYVNHDTLDEISESVARLETLAGESRADYLSECASIKLKLEYIKKDSGINLHSIF